MNKDFPRIITFLRKERGLSQKQAASDLEISQALLSHYEKGIRECGLDFLVRAAEYYDVSTDYLLGRTVQRSQTATADDMPDSDDIRHTQGNIINMINKKLLMNTTTIIYDLLAQMGSKKLTNTASNYLMNAEYQIFRMLYSAEKSNSQSFFSIDKSVFKNMSTASMMVDLEQAYTIIEEETLALSLSPDVLSGYFDKGASSLFNLIQFSERNIRNRIKSEL